MTLASLRGHRGFTLIELLVVIAIIGILSAVVLASLNSARTKGIDASIRANLATIQTQAELYYDTNGKYTAATSPVTQTLGNCPTTAVANMFGDTTIRAAVSGANTTMASSTAIVQCAVSDNAYMAYIRLREANKMFCVDSNGVATTTSTTPTGSACPS